MKKVTAILCFLVICLCSCSNAENYSGLRTSAYRSEYDCYDTNVQIMIDNMHLDAQQADTAFGVLADAGIGKEISNIIKMYDGSDQMYYRIWWGEDYSTSVAVYVEGGAVTKILSGEDVLYDADNTENSGGDDTKQVNGETQEAPKESTSDTETSDLHSDAPVQSGMIAVQSLTSPIRRGSTAHMEIMGIPGEEYSITVYYASSVSKAADLVPKIADESGLVTWKWKVGARTAPGTYKITVSGGGDTLETVFVVSE
ncbi:MAG: hypothetical protein HFE65_05305 [Clostridiales bacterium]|nr:hypothetical protein [Clostridiales bacterium]